MEKFTYKPDARQIEDEVEREKAREENRKYMEQRRNEMDAQEELEMVERFLEDDVSLTLAYLDDARIEGRNSDTMYGVPQSSEALEKYRRLMEEKLRASNDYLKEAQVTIINSFDVEETPVKGLKITF